MLAYNYDTHFFIDYKNFNYNYPNHIFVVVFFLTQNDLPFFRNFEYGTEIIFSLSYPFLFFLKISYHTFNQEGYR